MSTLHSRGRPRRRRHHGSIAWLLALLGGCYVGVGVPEVDPLAETESGPQVGSDSTSEDETGGDGRGDGAAPEDQSAGLIPARLFRNTNAQLVDLVRAAGFDVPSDTGLVPEPSDRRYRSHARSIEPSPAFVRGVQRLAESAAPSLADGIEAECDGDEACIHARLDDAARALYRRPLAPLQRSNIRAAFEDERGGEHPDAATRVTLEYLLQSPAFLFRYETGVPEPDDDSRRALTGVELAEQLSYTLWNAAPDAALIDAALAGELDDADGLERAAREMLESERFRAAFSAFLGEWIGFERLEVLSKDPAVHPDFERLRVPLQAEVDRFIAEVFTEYSADLSVLLGGPTRLDPALADVYSGDDTAEGVSQQRRGLVLLPGVVASLSGPGSTNPMQRSVRLLDRLFCTELELPSGVALPPPEPDAEPRTVREQFSIHTQDPTCAACHDILDPIAFAMEGFDPLGRARLEDDNGLPIDTAATIAFARGGFGDFANADEMMAIAADHPQVHDCFVDQYFEFALGVTPTPALEPELEKLRASFRDNGLDMRELAIALVTSDLFRFRGVEGE